MPEFIARDGPLGPITSWDAVFVLRQWCQPEPSRSFFQSRSRLKTCKKKWVDELEDWVQRVRALPTFDATSGLLKSGLLDDVRRRSVVWVCSRLCVHLPPGPLRAALCDRRRRFSST